MKSGLITANTVCYNLVVTRWQCRYPLGSWDDMLPSSPSKRTELWKITIFNGNVNYKWQHCHSYINLLEGTWDNDSDPEMKNEMTGCHEQDTLPKT